MAGKLDFFVGAPLTLLTIAGLLLVGADEEAAEAVGCSEMPPSGCRSVGTAGGAVGMRRRKGEGRSGSSIVHLAGVAASR